MLPATATPSPTPTSALAATPTTEPAGRSYTVLEGDTLSAIAARFDTTVDEIVALNPGLDPDFLSTGQVLKIPEGP